MSPTRKIRIGLNGFGRIGRSILRILLADPSEFEVVFINDIEPLDTCAYLFKYDSVFGPWAGTVETGPEALIVNGQRIPFHAHPDISVMDLSDVDIVFECTGMAGKRAMAERGLAAGASRVLISGPSDEADMTVVLGANDADIADHKIISNASCTTNALAPLLAVIDREWGLIGGHMTTVHCYTGSQPTVDKPRANPARSRAAALSMVPTTTSAHQLVGKVLPALAGKIEARAIRVPTASVSCIDLVVEVEHDIPEGLARARLKEIAQSSAVLGWTEEPLVSSDLRMRPESLVISGPELSISPGGLLRVFGWYDNEWGFSNRMLDMARRMRQGMDC
ncbi:glyceraldehyde 3-phosphate dehydrogenase [Aliiroseovarius crassostreae]|uniref:Glyceraldehyde-3-phosphate dehydrogenase n=1 Tax=Aliiroseovarius crassostreae TaxID=154981 RepID=A0A0P7IG18_9RHOB|nr:glyceraldehyde 3-phosphate dehydrogenase NAD-binding domain-containing protein [Aliiroseovarius crassostreae]KPN62830.1 glyceraldehyde-3-phosphate dehydrogenase [Aliiroseovarius crassostreae]SFU71512.1 glyceraldehyde 3-phosphate dehydrogenase [Aliiroseovarius crassostreae]